MNMCTVKSSFLSPHADNPNGRWDPVFCLLISRLAQQDPTVTRFDWIKAAARGSLNPMQAAARQIGALDASRNVGQIKAALLAGLQLVAPSAPVDAGIGILASRIAKERADQLMKEAAENIKLAKELAP